MALPSHHEMAVEAAIVLQLTEQDPPTVEVLGDWEHVAHQVPASPFKPPIWIDYMDLFGYSVLPTMPDTIERFLIAEVKAWTAQPRDIDQLLKYVDWVCREYAAGDYTMVRAFLIAYGFEPGVAARVMAFANRVAMIGSHPSLPVAWSDVSLIEYRYDPGSGQIQLAPWAPPSHAAPQPSLEGAQ
jgi:hypothetical protein